MSKVGKIEAHEILEKLDDCLPPGRKTLFRGFLLGILSEVNYLLNEIFWSFFSRGKRRRDFLSAIEKSPEKITQDKGFWMDNPKGLKMVRKPLDCLGKRNFSECLHIYFEANPSKEEDFNEHLRMRFLIFYENTGEFLKAVGELRDLRDSLRHSENQKKRLRGRNLRLSLYSLCYLVHPLFFGLLKGKVRTLSKGSGFEESVDEAFEEIQSKRKDLIKEQRKQFFGDYKTRKLKGRPVTRSWNQFKKKFQKRKEEWKSKYKLQNFIYQYQRINPEGIKDFANQRVPQYGPSFRDVEEIHGLLSGLDLLLWEYIPQSDNVSKDVRDLKNCLAHNDKIGASKKRCLAKEFRALLNCLDSVSANNFYTQAESMLKKRNHRVNKETGAVVRYKKGAYDKNKLENPKLLRRFAASIKCDLKKARQNAT